MSDDKSGNTTWDKEFPGILNNILDRDHTFPQPAELYTTWANIRMTQKAREDPHAPCVFERLITSNGGDLYAEFTWTGVYIDASRTVPYRTTPLLENMLRKDCRGIPDNPTTADKAEVLTFTVEFYELLAQKLKMQFGGLVTFPNLSGHSWLQHEAPRQLDADCIWILGSGRAICKPAYEIVVRSKREQLFGINLNQALEDYADYLYRCKFEFKDMSKHNACKHVEWLKQLETTSGGRNQIACIRYGFFDCLGVPGNEAAFVRALETKQTLQDEPWSEITWTSPRTDCEECWWVVNRPLKEAQVLLIYVSKIK